MESRDIGPTLADFIEIQQFMTAGVRLLYYGQSLERRNLRGEKSSGLDQFSLAGSRWSICWYRSCPISRPAGKGWSAAAWLRELEIRSCVSG